MLTELCQISEVKRCESNKIDRQEEEVRGWICSVDVDTGNKMFHRIPGYESIVIVKQRNSSICSISGVPRETKILKVT